MATENGKPVPAPLGQAQVRRIRLILRQRRIHRIEVLVQVRSARFVLYGESSEVPTDLREDLDIRQQPKSISRIAMILSWPNSILHCRSRLYVADEDKRLGLFTTCDRLGRKRADQ